MNKVRMVGEYIFDLMKQGKSYSEISELTRAKFPPMKEERFRHHLTQEKYNKLMEEQKTTVHESNSYFYREMSME